MSRIFTPVLTAVVLAVAVACGGGEGSTEKSARAAAPRESPAAKTADEAVRRVIDGIADGKPEVVWQALPAGYQRDVNDLLHQAAATMDAELWDGTFRVLGKITRVMSDKREFILSHPMVAGQLTNPREAYKNWDAVVGIFETIVKSDLADLESMKQLDVGLFLAETGGGLMRQMAEASAMTAADSWAAAMADLRKTDVTPVSESGDQAVVRIAAPGKPPLEEPFVRVEGRWVPERMARDWQSEIAEARERLASYTTESSAEARQKALLQLRMVESAIDTVLAAGSAEEFNASLGAILGVAMMAASQAQTTLEASAAPDPQAEPETSRPTARFEEPEPVEPQSREPEPIERERAEPAPHEAAEPRGTVTAGFDPDAIALDQVEQYVGRWIRIEGKGGLDVTGELVSVKGRKLRFEKRLRSGSAWFEIDRGEIRSLRLHH